MKTIAVENGQLIRAWIDGVQLEDAARAQLENVARLPILGGPIAIMPDVHWGMGATVGSVIPTVGAIVPAAVGVDIGCGMVATQTNLTAADLPDNLQGLRCMIEEAVPHGRTDDGGAKDKGQWRADSDGAGRFGTYGLTDGLKLLTNKHHKLQRSASRAALQFGTLGTGNHFIEVCLDESQNVWVMLHSGSRGIGNQIGTHFIALAKTHMERLGITLHDADLSWLPDDTEHFADYVEAVGWAQSFAYQNRAAMMDATLDALARFMNRPVRTGATAINCHHNYVTQETHGGRSMWITRKGAVRAGAGDMGIIPGSMGAASYIVCGRGEDASYHSCSHGAGRAMSRGAARRTFTLADHEAATAGVECRKDADVLDETPGAYKPIDAVMKAQADLVSIVHTLKQVVCVKG